jgi:hypothetical protein
MKEIWLQRIGWIWAMTAIFLLAAAVIMLLLVPNPNSVAWLESTTTAFATVGAPILGLVIVLRQPRNRYGWLWLIYALFTAIRTLSLAFFFFNHSNFTGYSPLGYFLLWLSEPVNLASILCIILLILWFPDGKLPSRRWRFLYAWMIIATSLLALGLFTSGTHWNGANTEGGIIIENPFGWIPENSYNGMLFAPLGFFSLILIFVFAVLALLFRYRSAGTQERLQVRWFVFGGTLFAVLYFLPVFMGFPVALSIIGSVAIILLYLSVGIAVLRYRLWDIDIIIRRTLVYGALTVILALVFFGSVTLAQQLIGRVSGTQNSVIAIVLSTLTIFALFSPLQRRIQNAIDLRFFRRKYDAQKMLEGFAASVRDEVGLDQISAGLLAVVEATMQPESVSLWLRQEPDTQSRPKGKPFSPQFGEGKG